MTLKIIWEDKKMTTILCEKHWMKYVLSHTSGVAGSLYYVLNTHSPKWRYLTNRRNMYCRVCGISSIKIDPLQSLESSASLQIKLRYKKK